MEARAVAKYIRGSDRKARLVIDKIKGKSAASGLAYLKFCGKASAQPIEKVLRSAMANARYAKGVRHPEELIIADAFVNQAPQMKRLRYCAQGRAARILKRSCHITIVLSDEKK